MCRTKGFHLGMLGCGDLAILGLLLLGGCVYDTRQRVDESVSTMVRQPYDQQPPEAIQLRPERLPEAIPCPAAPPAGGAAMPVNASTDARTVAYLESVPAPSSRQANRV